MRFDAAAIMKEILSQEDTPATSATLLPDAEKVVQASDFHEKSEVAESSKAATRSATFATFEPKKPENNEKRLATSATQQSPAHKPNPVRHLMDLLEGDIERYADALRTHGPMSYGQAMDALGWGATRAGKAEQALRQAGRIRFNGAGRAVLIEEGKSDA